MSQHIALKKKIGSTQNTRKITKAMELVAASRMKRFQRKALATREYALGLLDALPAYLGYAVQETEFGRQRDSGNTLFVVLTSDKGLCGSLNQQLIRFLVRSEEWNQCKPDERQLILIGKKSSELVSQSGIKPLEQLDGLPEQMTPLQALTIIEKILHHWVDKTCKRVIMVSPHYVNPFIYHPTLKTFLPLSEDMLLTHFYWSETRKDRSSRHRGERVSIFEPSHEAIFASLMREMAQLLFMQAFYELKATEYSSRMVAMKKATEAADDMLKTLTLAFNKIRQASITQQLAELAGGSIAQES